MSYLDKKVKHVPTYILLAEILRRESEYEHPAPVSRKYVGAWSDYVVAIGNDEIAQVTMPLEAKVELMKLIKSYGENYGD